MLRKSVTTVFIIVLGLLPVTNCERDPRLEPPAGQVERPMAANGNDDEAVADHGLAMRLLERARFWKDAAEVKVVYRDSLPIDVSRTDSRAAALSLYDRVVSEFPRSQEARTAYVEQLELVLWWADIDDGYAFTERSQLEARAFFRYAEAAADLLLDFERDFPDDPSLQLFGYVLAQEYRQAAGRIPLVKSYPSSYSELLEELEPSERSEAALGALQAKYECESVSWGTKVVDRAGEEGDVYSDLVALNGLTTGCEAG